jgi:hypothetical protein
MSNQSIEQINDQLAYRAFLHAAVALGVAVVALVRTFH